MTKLWNRLSLRERRLAMGAAGAVGLMVLYLLIMPAFMYIDSLDMQIDSLEDEVYNNTSQAARSEVVSKRYAELASQHSTGWTEAEINDGLQRELDRLSLAAGSDKKTAKAGKGGKLLEVTYRPEGQLTAYPEYREYQTTFGTQPTNIGAIAEFIRRIQESPQTLRIDRLDLRRDNPNARNIVAQITVTRTVVATTDGGAAPDAEPKAPPALPKGNFARDPSFEGWDGAMKIFPEWVMVKAAATPDTQHAVDGKTAAQVVATDGNAFVYQSHKLVAGQKYRVVVLAATKHNASFEVIEPVTRQPVTVTQALVADGNMYEYALGEFVAPGTAGAEVELGIPCIALKDKDSVVYLDKVVLEAITQ